MDCCYTILISRKANKMLTTTAHQTGDTKMNETIYTMEAVTLNGIESQWLEVQRKNLFVAPKDAATREARLHWGHCYICNRHVNTDDGANYVHIADNLVVPTNVEVSDSDGSQGWFPVGNDCIKKLPDGYARFYQPIA